MYKQSSSQFNPVYFKIVILQEISSPKASSSLAVRARFDDPHRGQDDEYEGTDHHHSDADQVTPGLAVGPAFSGPGSV